MLCRPPKQSSGAGVTNPMEEQTFKDALPAEAHPRFSAPAAIKPLQASMDNNTRQGDMADQASGNNEVHIAPSSSSRPTPRYPAGRSKRRCGASKKRHPTACAATCGEPISRRRDLNAIPLDAASASPARKNRTRDRPAAAAPGVLPREAGDDAAAPGRARGLIGQYTTPNNTYQYIVNREEAQLTWVAPGHRDLPNMGGNRLRRQRAGARPRKGKPAAAAPGDHRGKTATRRSASSIAGGRASRR